jgi:7-keto-8-aminopelargonate synthetase-like enzyme
LFVGSTPVPLPLANAALAAIKIAKEDKGLRRRLAQNVAYAKAALREAGLALPEAPGPILALHPKSGREAAKLKRGLLAAGIYPPFIRYPGGPAEGYFRFVISSEHTRRQLDGLIEVLVASASSFRPLRDAG